MDKFELIGSDIGNPLLKGSTTKVEGGYDIIAGGKDIWGTADHFQFGYREIAGDFDFTARLESLDMAHDYTKSGLMARESLEADSELVYIFAFPDNRPRNKNNGGYEFHCRNAKGASCTAVYPSEYTGKVPEFPVNFPHAWMRLKRTGDTFDTYCSEDGNTWKLYTRQRVHLSPTLFVGLAVTSHNDKVTASAKFRDITLEGL